MCMEARGGCLTSFFLSFTFLFEASFLTEATLLDWLPSKPLGLYLVTLGGVTCIYCHIMILLMCSELNSDPMLPY